MNLTIILPTLNRSDKLNIWLEYYSLNKYKGKILIIDSSNKIEKKKNLLLLKKFSLLDVSYIFLKKKNFRRDLLRIVKKKTKTKYAVYSGDDDFIFINALKYLINFLDTNIEYGGACGLGLVCFKDKKKFRTYKYDSIRGIENLDKFERLISQFDRYKYSVSIYSILRTKIWKNLKEQNFNMSNDISAELFYTFSIAYLARIKQFENLIYLIRMVGHKRAKLPKTSEKEIKKFSKFLNSITSKNTNKNFNNGNAFFYSLLKKKFKRESRNVVYPFRQVINFFSNFKNGKIFQRLIEFFRINNSYLNIYNTASLSKKKYKNINELNNFIKFLYKKISDD